MPIVANQAVHNNFPFVKEKDSRFWSSFINISCGSPPTETWGCFGLRTIKQSHRIESVCLSFLVKHGVGKEEQRDTVLGDQSSSTEI